MQTSNNWRTFPAISILVTWRQNIHMEAANQARVDLAKVKKKWEIYRVEREAGVNTADCSID